MTNERLCRYLLSSQTSDDPAVVFVRRLFPVLHAPVAEHVTSVRNGCSEIVGHVQTDMAVTLLD